MAVKPSELVGIPLSEEVGLGKLTLCGFLEEISERYGNNEAIVFKDKSGVTQRWTYRSLYDESAKIARALLAVGVTKDTRVGVLMTNRPEWILSIFGIAMAGAVGVALNTFSTRKEIEYQLQLADVGVLLMEGAVASNDFLKDLQALCPDLTNGEPGQTRSSQFPYLRRVVCVDEAPGMSGVESWESFVSRVETMPESIMQSVCAAVSPIDRALIFFSSGSTAMPKGILQTHRAATLQCWRFGRWFEIDSRVRTWSANGFFWSGNFAMALGGTLSVGGSLVLQRVFKPDETLELLESESVSLAIAWPHQEARLQECEGWDTTDLSSLTHVDYRSVLGKHPSVKTEWQAPTGYGMTETFTFVTGLPSSQSADGSHGAILPGNTLRIVDPENGAAVPWGEIGEIVVKGPTLTPGYLRVNPEETFDEQGFIHTGDSGYLSETGHLYWKGRLSDIIKTGGANVSPAEIDALLAEHPDVQAAFTVGIPHETLGELVVSCVVPLDGVVLDGESVRGYVRESLAVFKVPRQVLFFEPEEIPMTGSSKVKRGELKQLVIDRLS